MTENVLFIVLNFLVSKLVGEESDVGTQKSEMRKDIVIELSYKGFS